MPRDLVLLVLEADRPLAVVRLTAPTTAWWRIFGYRDESSGTLPIEMRSVLVFMIRKPKRESVNQQEQH